MGCMEICIEEGLREAEHRAALLRFMADAAAHGTQLPTPIVFNGIAAVSEDIERLVRSVRQALDVHALSGSLTDELG